jgi:2-C-methyl-D-erythritol 2,4-cyclodiphosphate synthase
MGWGDIGGRFPDTDPQYKDVPSSFFLKDVHGAVRSAGYHILNVDVTILAQKPRIAPFRSRMIDCLQQMLDAPVSIKAGTNEGCDSVGHGEAIAAHAVVLLARD